MKVKYPKLLLGGLALALVATISLAGCGPSATESALQTQNALLQQQNNQLQNQNDRLLDTRPAPVIVPPVYVPPPILIPPVLVPYPGIVPIRPHWYSGWHWPNWHRPHGPGPLYGPGPGSYHWGY